MGILSVAAGVHSAALAAAGLAALAAAAVAAGTTVAAPSAGLSASSFVNAAVVISGCSILAAVCPLGGAIFVATVRDACPLLGLYMRLG